MSKWMLTQSKWKLAMLVDPSVKTIQTLGIQVDQTFWLPPDRVVYCPIREFNLHDFKGRIVEGDWDDLAKKFEDLDIYVAMKQVCVQGGNWKETAFYQRLVERVSHGDFLWGCRDLDDIDRRCAYIQALYASIRDEGYKSQAQLRSATGLKNTLEDEVCVCIGRLGDLMFSDGAHRLAAAKLLRIDRIPMQVSVRHPAWITFRKELMLFAQAQGGALYQPALHPDLRDIPAFHECANRFSLINKHLSVRRGRLLDVGANIGYFCHRFEDIGFDCYAAEIGTEELYFLRKLKRAENKQFSIIETSILDYQSGQDIQFDVVLALNVFHHFLKQETDFNKLVLLLRRLKCKELFFEPHLPTEEQMIGAYRNFLPDEFAAFVGENTNLRRVERILECPDKRYIYKID